MYYNYSRPATPTNFQGMQSMPSGQSMQTMPSTAQPAQTVLTAQTPQQQAPPLTPVLGPAYTQGYLRTKIGSKIRAEFLIGSSQIQDRVGTLLHVAISYIIIREDESDDLLLCDIFSIKFVTIYQ